MYLASYDETPPITKSCKYVEECMYWPEFFNLTYHQDRNEMIMKPCGSIRLNEVPNKAT